MRPFSQTFLTLSTVANSRGLNSIAVALCILLLAVGTAVGAIPEDEREALISLYNSTNGDNWTNNENWLGPPGTEGSWYGVVVRYNSVDGLSLENNKLSGPIPPELGNLTKCTGIGLSNNQLTGSIPPELSNNPLSLIFLQLDNNQLSGPIPPELARSILLMRLVLHNNKLSGPIPPELGGLPFLLLLDLRHNELSGSIPPELGQLAELGGLALSNNMLSGPIPTELKNLKLTEENADFRFNALFTSDASLREFLNSKQTGGDWEGTQTVAPTNVTANRPTGDSIQISWTPIRFKDFGGGYRVFYSTSSGGPYTLFGTTDDKKASVLTVTGLDPETTYYFVVQAVTYPHDLNNNTVVSEYSEETTGVAPDLGSQTR